MENLRLLSIFYFIYGPLLLCCGSVPLIYVLVGFGMMISPPPIEQGGDSLPPGFHLMLGGMVSGISGLFVLLSWVVGGLAIYTGLNLQHPRKHKLCMICAALLCIYVPLGTILGVVTLICLTKSEVKELFTS